MTETKKRILLFSPAIYPCSVGGVEVFNYYLACELSKKQAIMIASTCKAKYDNSIKKVKLLSRLFILRRFGFSKLSIIISGFWQIAVNRSNIGVIHVPYTSSSGYLGVLFYFTKKMFRIPYIVHNHAGGMKQWKIPLFHQLLFKNAARIVAVSEIIKNEYERRTGRAIQVILPIIPFRRSCKNRIALKRSFGFESDNKIILVVGSIKPLKGSEIILRSFMKLGMEIIKNIKLKLIFVGDGQQKKELETLIGADREFNDHVHFWGNLPHEELPDIYAVADIYIIASWFEGTPISMLEAMYNALPIIGSNVPGINNIISNRKNGLLFEKNNDSELSAHIRYLIQNEGNAAEFGRKARDDYNKNYDYSTVLDAFQKIYDYCLSLT